MEVRMIDELRALADKLEAEEASPSQVQTELTRLLESQKPRSTWVNIAVRIHSLDQNSAAEIREWLRDNHAMHLEKFYRYVSQHCQTAELRIHEVMDNDEVTK